ncbi:MAG TPA: cytochrome d ubiquinol oxidase subunit II [Chitinophagaceae bacterium]
MLTVIIIILGVSFLLYAVLGGADFGAGIIEAFGGSKGEKIISRAIAPVWEANHVWLILAVVILFSAFPLVYSSLSLVLHIPLMIVLIGIICRGTAFTFRHYDIHEGQAVHRSYTVLFIASSFITPMFLGVTLGAMILGRITFDPSAAFYEKFMAPWLNIFCFTMGGFSTCLFAYIASVFLTGEARTEREQLRYKRISKNALLITAIAGLLVFVAAEVSGHHLLDEFLRSPISIVSFIIAAGIVPLTIYYLNRRNIVLLRVAVGAQVTAILMGWFAIQYPVLIQVSNGEDLTFFNTQAPQATLTQLLIALIVGLLLVVPAFVYLFGVFKVKKEENIS